MIFIMEILNKINKISVINSEKIIFYLLLTLNSLPILLFKYFPSQDGPSHLYNSKILLDLIFNPNSIYNNFFHYNFDQITNILSQLVLIILLLIFPDFVAEKILIISYIILFPISFRYLIKSINEKNIYLSYLGLLLVNNSFLYNGFHNFLYSLIFYNITIAYFINNIYKLNLKKILILNIFTFIILFYHIITFYFISLSIGSISIYNIIRDGQRGDKNIIKMKKFLFPLLSLVLPATYAAYFLFSQSRHEILWKPLYLRILYLLGNVSLVSFSNFDFLYSITLLAIILYLIIFRGDEDNLKNVKDRTIKDGFLLSGYILLFFIIIGPYKIGSGSFINFRLIFFFYFNLILYLTCYNYKKIIFDKIIMAIICIVIIINFNFYHKNKLYNFLIRDYIEMADHIEAKSVLLPINLSQKYYKNITLTMYINPLKHASNYICLKRNIISLDNYEAETDFFPIRFNDKANPKNIYKDLELTGNIDIKTYSEKTGHKIDYIILSGFDDKKIISEVINKKYKLIYNTKSNFNKLYTTNENTLDY